MCIDAKKQKIKARYVAGEATLLEISRDSGVSMDALKAWRDQEGWGRERKKNRARRRSALSASGNAEKLRRLLEASDKLEEALLDAVNTFSQCLRGEDIEKLTSQKTWADNLSHIAAAIGKQAETRMTLSGIMSRDEEEKLELMRRKQALEEQKEMQAASGFSIVMDRETEELSE